MTRDNLWHFADFRLDPGNAQLWRGEELCALRPKTFAVLCYLLEQHERLVTREELLTAVWPEVVVSDGVLSECIRELRNVLGDEAKEPRYIETVHRRGYRFVAAVAAPAPSAEGRVLSLGEEDRGQDGGEKRQAGDRSQELGGRSQTIARSQHAVACKRKNKREKASRREYLMGKG